MKKKLFKILLALTIIISSTLFWSELCFAQGEKYLLSEDGGNVIKSTSDANELITYMNDSSHFGQAKSYTLTLNDDLVIPVEGSNLKTLEIHCNLTIEGNDNKITGAEGGADGDRFIKIITEKGNVNINNLKFDGSVNSSPKYAGILSRIDTDRDELNLNLSFCTFENCKTGETSDGGAGLAVHNGANFILIKKDVELKSCSFIKCSAKQAGGAISVSGMRSLILEDTFISDCHATLFGGAIYTAFVQNLYLKGVKDSQNSCIENCSTTYEDNQGQYSVGGAITMHTSAANKLDISNYIIKGCSAKGYGGAIHVGKSNCNIKNSKFIGNKVEKFSGGAICINGGNLKIETGEEKTEFLQNDAIYGGAIALIDGSIDIKNTEFKRNKAKTLVMSYGSEEYKYGGNGAAIYLGPPDYDQDEYTRTFNISEDSIITENHADKFGGGIYSENGIISIDKSAIEKNTALNGGGLYLQGGSAEIKNESEIRENEARFSIVEEEDPYSGESKKVRTGKGAGLYIKLSGDNEYKIENSKITNNNAGDLGGGIYNEDSVLSIEKSTTIEKNSALNGGGIYIKEGLIKLDESVINENEARFSIVDEVDEDTGETKKVITGKGAGLYLSPVVREEKENKITNTKFTNNKAGSLGGGIYFLGEIYDLLAQYDPNTIKYDTEHIAYFPYYTELKNLTFEGNTAGFGFYNPPNDIATIKQGQAPISEDDYKALMSVNNSCKDKLIIKDADGKWQHIESLINNYDIDYINPITTTTYMENFGENGIYVNQELETKDYQNQDTNEISGHDIKVLSYEKTKLKENPDTTKPFKIWNTEKNGKGTDRKVDAEISGHKGNMTLFAQWGAKPVPPTPKPSEPTKYILRLDENYGGGEIRNIEVEEGDLIAPHLYIPHRGDYIFRGWSYDQKHLDEVKPEDRIYTDKTLYAIWEKADEEKVEKPERRERPERPERSERPKVQEEAKEIKGEEHKAYIFGYPNGTVRPKGSITRAEAAAMLSRLLNIEAMGSAEKPNFTDTESAWYNKAINAVVARGIMKGYPDGRFKPNAPITRAEFTQMISTIDNKPYGEAVFTDVAGHWAERAIGSEYQAKRITGYPDGSFRPNANITRAEAAVILNKIFERNYDASSILKCKNPQMINRFTDLQETFWGYKDMVEATNTHEYIRRYKDQNMNRIEEDWLFIK